MADTQDLKSCERKARAGSTPASAIELSQTLGFPGVFAFCSPDSLRFAGVSRPSVVGDFSNCILLPVHVSLYPVMKSAVALSNRNDLGSIANNRRSFSVAWCAEQSVWGCGCEFVAQNCRAVAVRSLG